MDATQNEAHADPASRLSWRMSHLDRYVLSRFAGIYTANLLTFTLLYVLIDLVNNIERFNKQSAGFADFVDACFLNGFNYAKEYRFVGDWNELFGACVCKREEACSFASAQNETFQFASRL